MIEYNSILELKDIWQYVFDASPDFIAIIDNNYNVLKINKAMANRLGVSSEEFLGLHCYKIVNHIDSPLLSCPHAALLKDGHENTYEIEEPVKWLFFGQCFTNY
jgi:PAS domain S-box-containing protein